MRTSEAALRATLAARHAYQRFSGHKAQVLTMTHFLTKRELPIDWTVPGTWDFIGCEGLDDQVRTAGSSVHVYGHACVGPKRTLIDGLAYVHSYLGTTDQHRPCMAPHCVYSCGEVVPDRQPIPPGGFNFKPPPRPEEMQQGNLKSRMGGG